MRGVVFELYDALTPFPYPHLSTEPYPREQEQTSNYNKTPRCVTYAYYGARHCHGLGLFVEQGRQFG